MFPLYCSNEIFHQCFLGPRDNIAAMQAAFALDLSLAGSVIILVIPVQNTNEKIVAHGILDFSIKMYL